MTFAQALITVGVMVLVVSVMTAPSWLGPHRGVWLQEAGIVLGIVAIAAGFYLRRHTSADRR